MLIRISFPSALRKHIAVPRSEPSGKVGQPANSLRISGVLWYNSLCL